MSKRPSLTHNRLPRFMEEAMKPVEEIAFQPTDDRVLVERIDFDEYHGLLAIPGTATRDLGTLESLEDGGGGNFYKGRVIAVGPGRKSTKTGNRVPCDVQPGDVVWFSGRWNDFAGWVDAPIEQALISEGDIACVVG